MKRSEVLAEPAVQMGCGRVCLDILGVLGYRKLALDCQNKGKKKKAISPPWMASENLLYSSLAAPAIMARFP